MLLGGKGRGRSGPSLPLRPPSGPRSRPSGRWAGAKLPSGRGLLALKIAARSPLTPAWVRDHWGLDPDVARQELEQLVQAGWLESRGHTRGKHYVLSDRARKVVNEAERVD